MLVIGHQESQALMVRQYKPNSIHTNCRYEHRNAAAQRVKALMSESRCQVLWLSLAERKGGRWECGEGFMNPFFFPQWKYARMSLYCPGYKYYLRMMKRKIRPDLRVNRKGGWSCFATHYQLIALSHLQKHQPWCAPSYSFSFLIYPPISISFSSPNSHTHTRWLSAAALFSPALIFLPTAALIPLSATKKKRWNGFSRWCQ